MQIISKFQNIAILLMVMTGIEIVLLIMLLFCPRSIEAYTSVFIICSTIYSLLCIVVVKSSLRERGVLLLTAIWFLLKILFLTYDPIGSGDYYRYLWDGKVQLNGINPFLYAPNDAALNPLHSEVFPAKVSYPHIRTIYFPVAQVLFAASFGIAGEHAWGLKLFLLLSEILILVNLYFLLRKFNLPIKYILLYAMLPLVHFQFFIDAHIDLVGVALMLSAVTLSFYQKKYLSYLFLGLSLSVKPTALLLLPLFFQNGKSIKDKAAAIFFPLTILAISFLPYIVTASPIDTLINFSTNWTFNGMIYNFIKLFIPMNMVIRVLCALFFFSFYIVLFFSKLDLFKKIYLSIFLLMIFSPIVHPWYLIWFAAFLPIIRSLSGLYYVIAISLTFTTVANFQMNHVWKEYPLVLLAEYLPVAVLFFYEMLKLKFNPLLMEESVPK